MNIVETTPKVKARLFDATAFSACPICGWRDPYEKLECDRCAVATKAGGFKTPTQLWHVSTRPDGVREWLPPESRGHVRKPAVDLSDLIRPKPRGRAD
jgi:hypothetical protein